MIEWVGLQKYTFFFTVSKDLFDLSRTSTKSLWLKKKKEKEKKSKKAKVLKIAKSDEAGFTLNTNTESSVLATSDLDKCF